ncbi:MAG: glycosyltransferase family 4 protein [Candidatus Hodarchaeota archaeon]
MKITFVTSHLTLFGGGGKVVMDFSNELIEKGYEINVVAQKIDQEKYLFKKGINLIEVGGPLPSNPIHWLKLKSLKKRYYDILNNLNSELIISLNFPANYFCMDIKKDKNVKTIYYCLEPYRFFHDKKFYSNASFTLRIITQFLRLFYKKYDIKGALAADEVVCISNFTKKRVKEIYGREGYLHYIGVDIEKDADNNEDFDINKTLNLKKDTPIIFTLGLSHHMKGVKEMMLIFKKILRQIPETVLLIGGSLIKKTEILIKKLIKKLQIPLKNVILYGFIEKLRNFYEKSTLTFYTAIDEPYGLIPLESMRYGTPVIAFEGGPSETILDGQTGYTILNHNLDEFAKRAIELIKNKKLFDSFSKKAIEHVKMNFDLQTSVSKLEAIFRKILSQK